MTTRCFRCDEDEKRLNHMIGGLMKDRVTGVMVYYYFVCKRKLWYFANEISMEAENEDVMLGKLLDEDSYKRNDKHINIDDVINIDFVKTPCELHEVKKSRSIEAAGIWQVKYYIYYLKNRGVDGITATIDYPLLRKKVIVSFSEEDEKELDRILIEIAGICGSDKVLAVENKKICSNCAYHDLCFI